MRAYQVQMDGARRRMRRERDASVSQAWLTAALSRTDKLPKLEKLLSDRPPADPAFALRSLSARLPKITLAEWQARQR